MCASLPLLLLSSCTLSDRDLDAFRETASGPAKIRAVLRDDSRPAALRAHAALSLLSLPKPQQGGIDAMLSELGALPDEARAVLSPALHEDLTAAMHGPAGQPPTPDQIRAKDAAFELLRLIDDPDRGLLGLDLLRWMLDDLRRRADAGEHPLEEVAHALGAKAAEALLSGLRAEAAPEELSRLAQIIDDQAAPATRTRAGAQLIAIEQQLRTPAFEAFLVERIRNELSDTTGRPLSPELARAQTDSRRQSMLHKHVMPSLGVFADQPAVRAHLVALARDVKRERGLRCQALELLAGHASEVELPNLLALSLDDSEDEQLRLLAIERAGETRSAEALPALLSLLSDRGHTALRTRAGVLVLTIGGPKVLPTFFRTLPRQWAMRYSKHEMSAYAACINAFDVDMALSMLLGEKLHSSHWWPRYLALHFFAMRGAYEDIWRIRQHLQDTMPILGEGFPKGHTVGQEAEAAAAVLLDRFNGR